MSGLRYAAEQEMLRRAGGHRVGDEPRATAWVSTGRDPVAGEHLPLESVADAAAVMRDLLQPLGIEPYGPPEIWAIEDHRVQLAWRIRRSS